MARESYVQVAADGSGKRIRNLALEIVQTDGSIATSQVQVTAIADENGNPIDMTGRGDLFAQLLLELRAIRLGIQHLVDWIDPDAGAGVGSPVTTNTVRQRATPPAAVHVDLLELAREVNDGSGTDTE